MSRLATLREFDDAAILGFMVSDSGHVLAAAVLDHVAYEVGEKFKVAAIDDRAAFTPGEDQPRIAHV